VSGGGGEPLTRRRVGREELDAQHDEIVASVLRKLVQQRLLVADEGFVELVHEALLEHWPRLAAWGDADREGRRVQRHVTEAAARWEAGRRDAGELYRGARLAAALDWADREGGRASLNTLEREFLDASRAASVRANRRLRVLLAGALVLLVV